MNESAVILRLDDNSRDGVPAGGSHRTWSPGELLSGEYRIVAAESDLLQSVEVSVLWYTEGKGDEDLAIHEFWRKNADGGDWPDPRRPERFSTTLPAGPLSYEGQIVKIRWCVRVRAFFQRGKELVGQKIFRLGNVPPSVPAKAKRRDGREQEERGGEGEGARG